MLRSFLTLVILFFVGYSISQFIPWAAKKSFPGAIASQSYEEYLKDAISKYSSSEQVVFTTSDFISESHEMKTFHKPQNKKILPLQKKQDIQNQEVSGNIWNFGTPPLPSKDRETNGCLGWLIYNPCLVIRDPIRASGGLSFWS